MDLTYRTELRELNELNFARFDAKVGERLAELRSEIDARFARADTVLAERLAALRDEVRADMDARLGKLDDRFGKLDDRFDKLDDRFDTLQASVRDAKVSTIIWTVAFWLTTILAILGVFLKK